jgi:hypothetical protein
MERRIRASSPGRGQIAQAHNFNNGCTICFNSVGLHEAGVLPERFGTALGQMWVMHYAAIFGKTSWPVGSTMERAFARKIQHGTKSMVVFFGTTSALPFVS